MKTPAIKFENDQLTIIDQTLLPQQLKYITIDNIETCIDAIKKLKVRGAPAIGIFAAYGLYVVARSFKDQNYDTFKKSMNEMCQLLVDSRPTAVNLAWAVNRIQAVYATAADKPVSEIIEQIKSEAVNIHDEDRAACKQMGYHGLSVVPNPSHILTHCNTGSLATGGWGTALGVVYAAQKENHDIHVYIDETRPLGQGARLTFWELMQNNIPCTLITDNAVGSVMKDGKIDLVLFGADRIARNGDVANKIGSYNIAALARLHHIPCYAVAPSSTFDLTIASGMDIEIELRNSQEILHIYGYNDNLYNHSNVYNPAFDVTPAEFISGIITEKGIIEQPTETKITEIIK
jgi:methylthioribose-1-phosphate isomerase